MSRKPNKCHIRPKKSLDIYDLRFTIWEVRRAELAKLQSKCGRDEAVIGRGYKAAVAGGA